MIDHARLDHGDALRGIEPQNAIEPVQRDDDAACDRQRTARQARAAAARDERQPFRVAEAHQRDHFLRVSGIATARGVVRNAVSPSLS